MAGFGATAHLLRWCSFNETQVELAARHIAKREHSSSLYAPSVDKRHYMVEMCTSIRVVCSRLRKLATPNNQQVSSYVTLTFTAGATAVLVSTMHLE